MIVIVAKKIPPTIKGKLSLWFIEASNNVFVSGVKDFLADKIVNYLFDFCKEDSLFTVYQDSNQPPGYKIRTFGSMANDVVEISGLQLIRKKNNSRS